MPIVAFILFLLILLVMAAAIALAAMGVLAALALVVILLVLLACMGLLGAGLFVWGLWKRRRARWIAGLVMMLVAVVSAVAVVSLAGYGAYRGYRAWRAATTANPAKTDHEMRGSFESATGVALPPEAAYVAGGDNSLLGGWLSQYQWKIRVPPEFVAVLDARLERQPGGMPQALRGLQKEHPDWGLADSPSMVYYTSQTGTVDTGGFTGAVAIDGQTGVMYCEFDEYTP